MMDLDLSIISWIITGISLFAILLQIFGVMAGADGWGFSKSLVAFLAGAFSGFVFSVLIALYFSEGNVGLSVGVALLAAFLSGQYMLHRFWADYYYSIIAIPFLITAVALYCLMRFQFDWTVWWKPLLVAMPVGYTVGWCYWIVHRFIYPYVWVGTNALAIAASVTVLKVTLFRRELVGSIIDNYQQLSFWKSLPDRLGEELIVLLIVWVVSCFFIAYIWHIQRFKQKWRTLVTNAKEWEANPYGSLSASLAMALKGFRQTAAGMFLFRRISEPD